MRAALEQDEKRARTCVRMAGCVCEYVVAGRKEDKYLRALGRVRGVGALVGVRTAGGVLEVVRAAQKKRGSGKKWRSLSRLLACWILFSKHIERHCSLIPPLQQVAVALKRHLPAAFFSKIGTAGSRSRGASS